MFEDLWPLQKRSDVEPGGLRAAAPHGAVMEGPGVGELRTLDFPGQPRRNAEPEPAGPAATRAWSRALRSAAVGEGSGNGRRGRPASGSAQSPERLRGTDVRRASGPRPRACAALPAAPLAWGAAPHTRRKPPRCGVRARFGLARPPSTTSVPCSMEKIGSAAVGITQTRPFGKLRALIRSVSLTMIFLSHRLVFALKDPFNYLCLKPTGCKWKYQ